MLRDPQRPEELKLGNVSVSYAFSGGFDLRVAPHVGAWIEITMDYYSQHQWPGYGANSCPSMPLRTSTGRPAKPARGSCAPIRAAELQDNTALAYNSNRIRSTDDGIVLSNIDYFLSAHSTLSPYCSSFLMTAFLVFSFRITQALPWTMSLASFKPMPLHSFLTSLTT